MRKALPDPIPGKWLKSTGIRANKMVKGEDGRAGASRALYCLLGWASWGITIAKKKKKKKTGGNQEAGGGKSFA